MLCHTQQRQQLVMLPLPEQFSISCPIQCAEYAGYAIPSSGSSPSSSAAEELKRIEVRLMGEILAGLLLL